jgi:hypothetical protein
MAKSRASRRGRRGWFASAWRVFRPRRPSSGWHCRTVKSRRLVLDFLEDRALLSVSLGNLVWSDLN